MTTTKIAIALVALFLGAGCAVDGTEEAPRRISNVVKTDGGDAGDAAPPADDAGDVQAIGDAAPSLETSAADAAPDAPATCPGAQILGAGGYDDGSTDLYTIDATHQLVTTFQLTRETALFQVGMYLRRTVDTVDVATIHMTLSVGTAPSTMVKQREIDVSADSISSATSTLVIFDFADFSDAPAESILNVTLSTTSAGAFHVYGGTVAPATNEWFYRKGSEPWTPGVAGTAPGIVSRAKTCP